MYSVRVSRSGKSTAQNVPEPRARDIRSGYLFCKIETDTEGWQKLSTPTAKQILNCRTGSLNERLKMCGIFPLVAYHVETESDNCQVLFPITSSMFSTHESHTEGSLWHCYNFHDGFLKTWQCRFRCTSSSLRPSSRNLPVSRALSNRLSSLTTRMTSFR